MRLIGFVHRSSDNRGGKSTVAINRSGESSDVGDVSWSMVADISIRPRGRCAPASRVRDAFPRAFTLIELLLVLAILGVLAAITFPMFTSSTGMARVEASASNVHQIRTLIMHHTGLHDVPLSAGGYPATIDGSWFPSGVLPNHSWTDRPMILEVVNDAIDVVFPAVKTYNPAVPADPNCWYNSTNGTFCVRVPPMADDAQTLETFNEANKVGAGDLDQTTQ